MANRIQQNFDGPPEEYPKMIWPTNYFKLACATMFTLFWAGKRFAPDLNIKGMNIQEFLQTHYIRAMQRIAQSLAGLPNVVGFGTMNEPSAGYVNVPDLNGKFCQHELRYGFAPTPFQGMCLGEGRATDVAKWSNGFRQHVLGWPDEIIDVDPEGIRAWALSRASRGHGR